MPDDLEWLAEIEARANVAAASAFVRPAVKKTADNTFRLCRAVRVLWEACESTSSTIPGGSSGLAFAMSAVRAMGQETPK